MTKAELNVLARVYAAEVRAALEHNDLLRPFQTRSKVARELCYAGFLAHERITVPGRPFAITVEGYVLTHAGRLVYCASC